MDVSIIITTYNYESYIKECIESCLNQKDTDFEYEIVVVDDGSIDNTSKILNLVNNPKLKKLRIDNSGIEKASNYGFANAIGDYLVRVDADDRLLPNYLSNIQKYIDKKYDFFYPDYRVVNENGSLTEKVFLPDFNIEEIFCRGDFLATGTMFSKGIIKKFGGYSENIKNSGLENYEFIIKLILSGVNGKHIPELLFDYRRHSSNISEIKKSNIVNNGINLFKKYNLGEYKTNEFHPYKLRLV